MSYTRKLTRTTFAIGQMKMTKKQAPNQKAYPSTRHPARDENIQLWKEKKRKCSSVNDLTVQKAETNYNVK